MSAPVAWSPAAVPHVALADVRVIAEGLKFPEGPVALGDGSVLVTEIERGTVTRVGSDGTTQIVADCGGGPNGAAFGPDGLLYVCNNGGRYATGNYKGGWIERVDVRTGAVERLFTHHEGRVLSGPNDIVFDEHGGFWFTDTGKFRGRERDVGSLYYVSSAGELYEAAHPVETPNGIGLSPDGTTLYYAETTTGRLRRRTVEGPGRLTPPSPHNAPETLVAGLPGHQSFDSLAVDRDGNVCVTTFWRSCITVISPDGSSIVQHLLPSTLGEHMPTNICFGGEDLRTAYITLGLTGRLISCRWPVPGLAAHFRS